MSEIKKLVELSKKAYPSLWYRNMWEGVPEIDGEFVATLVNWFRANHQSLESVRSEAWRKLYMRAFNCAADLTNYVENRPELRRNEKEMAKLEEEARALQQSPARVAEGERTLYTQADMESACALVLAGFRSKPVIEKMVNRFLAWPLPDSVCADPMATKQGPGRIGTNLLTFTEAREMLDYVLQVSAPESPAKEQPGERHQGKYRLVYNKVTKKIDKISNFDGLAVESFDPPTDCDFTLPPPPERP